MGGLLTLIFSLRLASSLAMSAGVRVEEASQGSERRSLTWREWVGGWVGGWVVEPIDGYL